MSDALKRKIVLAGVEYHVERVPMARIKQLSSTIAEVQNELKDAFNAMKEDKQADQTLVDMLVNKVLEAPHAILSLFIKKLPVEIFTDPDDGVTFPELLDAFKVVLEHNRLDVLKNAFTRLLPALVETNQKRAR